MPARKYVLFLLSLAFLSVPAFAQTASSRVPGEFAAEGSGTGSSAQAAVESAKIAAVNALVKSVIKRDAVFRDLLMGEAFKNDWFRDTESKELADKSWEAKTVVRIDEGAVDALYYGRYSTTVGALLDGAEAALAEASPLVADGGARESNGDLGGAETSYLRAASKADEAMRLVGPVEDAVFFSTTGNRKAPELKAMIAALRSSADEGLKRVKAGRDRLAVDSAHKNVLDLLQTVDDELKGLETAAAELYPIAEAPRSYEAEKLAAARARAASALDSLARRRRLVSEKEAGLTADMEYPKTRVKLILDRIDALSNSFRSVSSSVGGELFRRSPPVQAVSWFFGHAPLDVVAVGFTFPYGAAPGSTGIDLSALPLRLDARGEAAFSLGDGGIWCRATALYDSELLFGGDESVSLSQGVDIGFFGKGLFAVGFRWDWLRSVGESRGTPVKTVSVTFGSSGAGLGSKRWVPLWITTFSWELPPFDGFIFARDVNLGIESVIRPSTWLRLEAGASSRVREASDGGYRYAASGKLGFGFRLPVFRPILWRVSYEGTYRAPIAAGNVEWSGAASGAFRFGLEYAF